MKRSLLVLAVLVIAGAFSSAEAHGWRYGYGPRVVIGVGVYPYAPSCWRDVWGYIHCPPVYVAPPPAYCCAVSMAEPAPPTIRPFPVPRAVPSYDCAYDPDTGKYHNVASSAPTRRPCTSKELAQ